MEEKEEEEPPERSLEAPQEEAAAEARSAKADLDLLHTRVCVILSNCLVSSPLGILSLASQSLTRNSILGVSSL
jgi:hypothetical protein